MKNPVFSFQITLFLAASLSSLFASDRVGMFVHILAGKLSSKKKKKKLSYFKLSFYGGMQVNPYFKKWFVVNFMIFLPLKY